MIWELLFWDFRFSGHFSSVEGWYNIDFVVLLLSVGLVCGFRYVVFWFVLGGSGIWFGFRVLGFGGGVCLCRC